MLAAIIVALALMGAFIMLTLSRTANDTFRTLPTSVQSSMGTEISALDSLVAQKQKSLISAQKHKMEEMTNQLAAQAAQLAALKTTNAAPEPAAAVTSTVVQPAEASGSAEKGDGVLCVLMAPPLKTEEVEWFWKLVGKYSDGHCTAIRIAATEKFFRRGELPDEPQWIQAANKSRNVAFSMHKLREEESIANLWEKTYTSFIHSYQHELDKYGWFVGMNTDAIIVCENLNRLVSENSWSPDGSYYLGHTLHHRSVSFNAGGLYVFSRGALRKVGPRLVQLLTEPRNPNQGLEICYDTASQEEDVKLGSCFKEVGVLPTLSKDYDKLGRDAFFNFRLKDHHQLTWAAGDWFWEGKDRAREEDCCSDYPIQDHNFKNLDEHMSVLTKIYDSPSYKATGYVTKLDWLKAEGCAGLGKNTKWASRSECP